VTRVQENPTSRYFLVFNDHLMSNPDLATKIRIALERMDDELKDMRNQEAKEAIRAERRQQAMAVVEAAYNKISQGARGRMTEFDKPLAPKKRMTDEELERADPITRFKQSLEKPSTLDLMELGDLAERDPFYLMKKKKHLPDNEEGSPSVDQKKVVYSDPESDDYMQFISPHGDLEVDEEEVEEDNYDRRQYYGLIPIDGHTFARKLNP
jgi:hypothetical protein